MSRVAVVGGGAAGMMAAVICARNGHSVTLFEKNEKLGKKLYITGKGRCNLTNACGLEELFGSVVTNPRFLYSAFHSFTNEDTITFFESIGLKLKVERGQRVFPASDRSSDVISALERELKRQQVKVQLNTKVLELVTKEGCISGVHFSGGSAAADAVILATGGLSYPTTGSTGDGYLFARQFGHTVTSLFPSLVSIRLDSPYPAQLEGLSLKNIKLRAVVDQIVCEKETDESSKEKKKRKTPTPGKVLYENFGELVFTSRGISGPLALSASSYIAKELASCAVSIHIDLKPALSKEQLDARILRDFDEIRNKRYKNALEHLLPQKLIPVIISLSGISPDKQVNLISREERKHLAALLKDVSMSVESLGGYEEAVVTKGGIAVKEVNPSTMESKLVPGLYFAGEVLDVDALTGGFNLQIAWSSGHLAANGILRGEKNDGGDKLLN